MFKNSFFHALSSYIRSESGATAVEYGLIAAGISLAIVAVVFTFGDTLEGVFTNMEPALRSIAAEVVTNN